MSKSRNWVFTRQSTPEEAAVWERANESAALLPEPFNWHGDAQVTYVSYQIERAPDTGKLHVQGMISFKNPKGMSLVKHTIGNEPHVEICKDPVKAAEYTQKAETRVAGPWEHGEKPVGKGKKKVKVMEEIYKAVKSGRRTSDMVDANPGFIAHGNAIKLARFCVNETHSDRQRLKALKVILSYGETDLGKTYSAINFIAKDGDYYIVSPPMVKGGAVWFDGYEGQKTLILDDWDGQCIPISSLKRWLDVYKLQLQVKGGYTWAEWDTVVITSNLHPNRWFINFDGTENSAIVQPFRRRITEIRHYIEKSFYQVVDWDGTPEGDIIHEQAPSVHDSGEDTEEDISLVCMADSDILTTTTPTPPHTATGL